MPARPPHSTYSSPMTGIWTFVIMADSIEITEKNQGPIDRRKSRRACEPCRRQKRKCDGQEPCNSRLRYTYHCYFDNSLRKRARVPNSLDTGSGPGMRHVSPRSVAETSIGISVFIPEAVAPTSFAKPDRITLNVRQCRRQAHSYSVSRKT
jgi:hypothetical protein